MSVEIDAFRAWKYCLQKNSLLYKFLLEPKKKYLWLVAKHIVIKIDLALLYIPLHNDILLCCSVY